MKKVLITGIAGQDGSYLAEFLLEENYEVFGIERSFTNFPAKLKERIKYCYEADITKPNLLNRVIRAVVPDEIYHLAAYHFSSQNEGNKKESFKKFYLINLLSTNEILETIRIYLPSCRFFYASSCQVFGKVDSFPQNEETSFLPDSLYSITKTAGANLCKFYRDHHNLYTSVGILYNHESVRRSSSFVTTQIAESAAKAFLGIPVKLELRDLDAHIDWGAAKDYVRAMWLTLQPPNGDDYIISSGVTHSVREFAKIAFNEVGLDSSDFVFQDPKIKKKSGIPFVGDNTKIKNNCNWHPTITFNDLIKEMVQAQLSLLNTKKPG
jgi:GDPmannose 4,6-dehydratase